MRIWSLHPKYLDSKGLVALWRETLLAKKVLTGGTKAYSKHPQLIRFYDHENPVRAINFYLKEVWIEANKRSYNFDKTKFENISDVQKIHLTFGQLEYEVQHLMNKLKKRDSGRYNELKNNNIFESHPLFFLIEGNIESWERIY
jgi:hypothetical protein